MKFKASQIAMMLQGQLEGADVEVSQLSKIEEGKTGSLTFLSNPKYTPFIYQTEASVAIVAHDFESEQTLPSTLSLIRVADAYGAFAQLLEAYNQFMLPQPGISSHAVIASSAKIGVNVHIGDFVTIGEGVVIEDNVIVQSNVNLGNRVTVGEGSVIYPGVRIYHDCVIGKKCTLHANAVIGSDGFGFAPDANGVFKKVPQIGNVVLEDNVDVGAGSIVGALCFVPADMKIPPRSVVVGNPAKIVKEVSDEMLAWKSDGTRLYQQLPAAMRASWRAVEPLRDIPADRPTQSAVLKTWQETRPR
jgi:UDP-3-O-[3-hydroxymyristoyl] glucosamine N-acyltransferase